MIKCIRICLNPDGTVAYYPLFEGEEDYRYSMDPEDALYEITGGSVPVEIACNDPMDDSIHNYETLLESPDMDAQSNLVDFVQEKAEAGRIEWEDDAPVFFGLIEQLQEKRTKTTVLLQKI